MRYLLILLGSGFLSLFGFSQNAPTITLVFVPSANSSNKNFEAVIDEVSYYSENNPVSANKSHAVSLPATDRNTIWLNNFQPGKHTIKVYNLKKGTRDVRAGNVPVYGSAFIVKNGFDTKIAVERATGRCNFRTGLAPVAILAMFQKKIITFICPLTITKLLKRIPVAKPNIPADQLPSAIKIIMIPITMKIPLKM